MKTWKQFRSPGAKQSSLSYQADQFFEVQAIQETPSTSTATRSGQLSTLVNACHGPEESLGFMSEAAAMRPLERAKRAFARNPAIRLFTEHHRPGLFLAA